MYAEHAESVQDQRAERILAQTAALLAQRGDEQAVALLVDVQSVTIDSTSEVMRRESVFLPDIEGGIWGTETIYRQEAVLDVEDHLVPRFTDEICERIAETLSYVAERNGRENVVSVGARPALPEIDADWRTALGARLTLDRPVNQARHERPAACTRSRTGDVRQRRGTAGLPGAQAPTGQFPAGRHDLDRAASRCLPALG